VIHHGVDAETFHPRNRALWRPEVRRQVGVGADTPVALYVGDYQKGLVPTLRALARVPDLHLVGVARSPVEPYQDLICELGVADRVHLMPASASVERYYATADVFVFPTFYDPFGLVATEAMASGLPVICSAAAGASEVIQDGVDGFVVQDPWDADALAAPLRQLVEDPALRQKLGAAARRKAEAHTWDEVARQTLGVYREVVEQNGRAG
jgi:glycosyltransferase involved in cell wall biosynthesis